MNITVYAFNVLAARLLVPQEFGALTALFGIMLVGTVASLGLQAVTARRLAVAPDARDEIIAATVRVTALVASAVGLAVAASTVVLTPGAQARQLLAGHPVRRDARADDRHGRPVRHRPGHGAVGLPHRHLRRQRARPADRRHGRARSSPRRRRPR